MQPSNHFMMLVLHGLTRTLCTCSELADCVQELELPALFDIMDGFGYFAARRLNVELQTEAVDVSVACKTHRMSCDWAAENLQV